MQISTYARNYKNRAYVLLHYNISRALTKIKQRITTVSDLEFIQWTKVSRYLDFLNCRMKQYFVQLNNFIIYNTIYLSAFL